MVYDVSVGHVKFSLHGKMLLKEAIRRNSAFGKASLCVSQHLSFADLDICSVIIFNSPTNVHGCASHGITYVRRFFFFHRKKNNLQEKCMPVNEKKKN